MIEPSIGYIQTLFIAAATFITIIIMTFYWTKKTSTAHSCVITVSFSGINTVAVPALLSVGIDELTLIYTSLPFLMAVSFFRRAIDEVIRYD